MFRHDSRMFQSLQDKDRLSPRYCIDIFRSSLTKDAFFTKFVAIEGKVKLSARDYYGTTAPIQIAVS